MNRVSTTGTTLIQANILALIALAATFAKTQIFTLCVARPELMLMKLTLENAQLARKEPSSGTKDIHIAWSALLAIRAIMRKVALRLAQRELLLPTKDITLAAKLAPSALERPA